MRHPSVHPPMVINTKTEPRTVLLHLASRVLAPKTQLATNRSDLPPDLSLNLSEPPTELDQLFSRPLKPLELLGLGLS